MSDQEAQILSGTEVAKEIRAKLKAEVKALSDKNLIPGLAMVQVGHLEDSNIYTRNAIKAAQEIGINAIHVQLPKSITESELLNEINKLNSDSAVHGIIILMPLDSVHKIDANKVTDAVLPLKDVDGLNAINAGKLARGVLEDSFSPCGPNGCLELIKRTGKEISGSNAVVVGRSPIVGMPMSELLIWNNATVTTCHSETTDLPKIVETADILVVAVRHPQMIKGDWIKKEAVVIDFGINPIPDSTKESGYRLVGDVDFESGKKRASFITPVPGGVGPVTVSMLMSHTVEAATRSLRHSRV